MPLFRKPQSYIGPWPALEQGVTMPSMELTTGSMCGRFLGEQGYAAAPVCRAYTTVASISRG